MTIYSGSGDWGKTSLLSGERVPKSHPQIEACGDLDELNSVIGGIKALLPLDCRDLSAELYRIPHMSISYDFSNTLILKGKWECEALLEHAQVKETVS
jgi:cob(I)alamin adenosyltransferase